MPKRIGVAIPCFTNALRNGLALTNRIEQHCCPSVKEKGLVLFQHQKQNGRTPCAADAARSMFVVIPAFICHSPFAYNKKQPRASPSSTPLLIGGLESCSFPESRFRICTRRKKRKNKKTGEITQNLRFSHFVRTQSRTHMAAE